MAHLDREEVLADGDVLGNVKFCRDAAVLAVTEKRPIEPAPERRVDALEDQRQVAAGDLVIDGDPEAEAVAAGRVVAGHKGRIDVEGVLEVGVDGRSVALRLPVTRHVDLHKHMRLGQAWVQVRTFAGHARSCSAACIASYECYTHPYERIGGVSLGAPASQSH